MRGVHTHATVGLALMLVASASAPGSAPALPPGAGAQQDAVEIVLASELQWQPLNPARGDASPMAADVWGDRRAPGPTGFLVRFADGFASPPHVHNVSYRGVVIQGLVHNNEPSAEPVWMPVGSYWTQPRGASHVTAASGGETIAYIEIDDGPYLVHPTDDAFESDERAVNMDPSRLSWTSGVLGAGGHTAPSPSAPQVALLWGDPDAAQASGRLVRFAAGATVALRTDNAAFHVVVIGGAPAHVVAGQATRTSLDPGSGVSSDGGDVQLSCDGRVECVLYVRADQTFEVHELAGDS